MKASPHTSKWVGLILSLSAVMVLAGRFAEPLPAQAGVWSGNLGAPAGTPLEKGVFSKNITVCFVGNAVTARQDRVRQIVDYIKAFEHAANIRFRTLAGQPLGEAAVGNIASLACPPPTKQSNGYDHFAGDIRVVIPNIDVNANDARTWQWL